MSDWPTQRALIDNHADVRWVLRRALDPELSGRLRDPVSADLVNKPEELAIELCITHGLLTRGFARFRVPADVVDLVRAYLALAHPPRPLNDPVPPAVAEFFDKQLLQRAAPQLVRSKVARRKPIARKNSFVFRRITP